MRAGRRRCAAALLALLLCALAGCGAPGGGASTPGPTHTHEAILLDTDPLAVWVTASEGRQLEGLCYMSPAEGARFTGAAGGGITAADLRPGQLIRAVDKDAAELWTEIYPPTITPDEVTVLGEADPDAFAAGLKAYDALRSGPVTLYCLVDGRLHSEEQVLVRDEAEVFAAWRQLNGLPVTVELEGFTLTDNGYESSEQIPGGGSSTMMTYTMGDTARAEVLLSPAAAEPLAALPDAPLLLEGLARTLAGIVRPYPTVVARVTAGDAVLFEAELTDLASED